MDKSEQKEAAYAEIMYLFRYFYNEEGCPESIFANKSRIWVQAFNDLIKQGYIERKKESFGYKYKWKGTWPENF